MTEAIKLLTDVIATLPKDHRDRPGLVRSVELLRTYGSVSAAEAAPQRSWVRT